MVAGAVGKGTKAGKYQRTNASAGYHPQLLGTKVSLWSRAGSTIAELPKVRGGRMAKVRPLVILLIVAMTIALGDSWCAVGAVNAANLSGSLAQCCGQSFCDDDEPQPASNSKAVDTNLAYCEHDGACACLCCHPLVGIVQLVVDQRRVKSSNHCQAQLRDQFDARRLRVQLESSLRAPQRPPGAHTASLLGLSCLLIV